MNMPFFQKAPETAVWHEHPAKKQLPAGLKKRPKKILAKRGWETYFLFLGEKLHAPLRLHGSTAPDAIRRDDWKLVRGEKGKFKLYNLKDDMAESSDLTKAKPEKS